MAKRMAISQKEVVHMIWNGATWEDVEARAGNHRTTIQRKLKGEAYTDGKGNTRLKGGHYKTMEGYKRLLKKARENEKLQKTKTSPEHEEKKQPACNQHIRDKAGVEQSCNELMTGRLLLVDTSYLLKRMQEGKSLFDLMTEYQAVYIPQRCIAELEKQSHNRSKPKLMEMAKNILEEITSKKSDEKLHVIGEEECMELFVNPRSFERPMKDRTKAVVAALCSLYRKNGEKNITCITSTVEIAKWCRLQQFSHKVSIYYEEPIYLD